MVTPPIGDVGVGVGTVLDDAGITKLSVVDQADSVFGGAASLDLTCQYHVPEVKLEGNV